MKQKLCLFLGVFIVMGTIVPFVVQGKDTENAADIPAWLERTSYGVSVETGQKPRMYFETVQPLYQDYNQVRTVFTHGRISHQNERGTYSIGFGYRHLFSEEFLGGINSFFDYQDLHQHYRSGVGIEAIGKRFEGRVNAYFGLSPERKTGALGEYEKAVDGYDIEFGGPVPHLPWLKLFGSYYEYDFKKFSDLSGWKARVEIKPYKFLTVNFETYDDNKGSQEYRVDTRITLAFHDFTPESIFAAFKPSQEAYPEVDLRDRALDRVERNFNIITEKWVKTGNVIVEAKRRD